ncbi:HK97 family phage prohead protease [Fibrella sp. WM1]|uniref:HK97 family phage prohead protease n=1 Tax=Fibrella musci TaxID=3242485 RepID=UPI003522697B
MAFCVSDESVNSHGFRVLQSGADTEAFERNPIMLYMHQRGKVIGKWENLRWEDGKLYVDEVFDLDDTSEGGGKEIGGKVERGFLRAASIGLVVIESAWDDALQCPVVTKWRLQEISIVDVGSNSNALQLYDQAGEPLGEMQLSALLNKYRPPATSTRTQSQTTTMELATVLTALGLAATASDTDVLNMAAKAAGYDALKIEHDKLLKTQKETLELEAKTLVDQAHVEKRITAEQKPIYMNLFAADHANAKLALEALPKPKDLVALAANGGAAAQGDDATREADKKRFHELDKSGGLMKLAQTDRPTFERLYEAAHGVKPTNVQV